MAQSLPISSIKICTAFMLAILGYARAEHFQFKETKMSVFFQDIAAGPNATISAVAGIPGTKWDFLKFGSVFVIDDPITERMERDSTEIGRGQGISATSSLDGLNAHIMISIAFTNKEYNGSTLEIQGRRAQLDSVQELSIVSGTGKFRFARGYATFETVFFDPSIFYFVTRCNITVVFKEAMIPERNDVE